MGHANAAELKRMVSDGIVTRIKLTDADMPACKSCIASKHSKASFPAERSSLPSTRYGKLVHCDVWGPANTQTFGGRHYYCLHIDDYSNECILSLLCTKDEVFPTYKEYEAWAKQHRNVTAIGAHQSDRGGEYMDNNLLAHLRAQGTSIHRTIHDSPTQNGKAERLN
jgi:transposase InsO family protein